jgi:sugar phosphate isomerase/epimerase
MNKIPKDIVCCYLYTISKYGYPPPAKDTIQHINEMHALGFQSIELEGIRAKHLMEVYQQKSLIKAELNRLKIAVPYFCIVLPGLSAIESAEREKNLDLFKKGCEIAQFFNAKGVLDNAPLPPWQFPSSIPVVRHYEEDTLSLATIPKNLNWETYWKDLVQTYQKACDIAANYNLTYQMHPAMGVLAANTGDFLHFAQAVNRSNLRFNFDISNLFAIKENISLSLIRLAKYINYIHLSDNGGLHTEHLAIGAGKIAWSNFFETLKTINFKGHFGIDIGGSESKVADLDKAYVEAALFISSRKTE